MAPGRPAKAAAVEAATPTTVEAAARTAMETAYRSAMEAAHGSTVEAAEGSSAHHCSATRKSGVSNRSRMCERRPVSRSKVMPVAAPIAAAP